MVISIFGLGYVGCISLACLADMGFNVIGVDIVEEKVNLINSGKSTVVEEQVEELIEKNRNKIEATVNTELAFSRSDVSFICVPTPNENNGALDLSYLRNVISQIAQSIKLSQKFHTVVIRSTVPPGTNREMCSLIEQISSKKSGVDFGVVSNPEFLREGSAVKDFFNPPYTLIASESELALAALKQIYSHLNAEIIVSKLEVAEILKYVNNTFHALKISFANEIGNICNSLKIDSHELMDIFCKDE
ncbi:MAG: nucleotide sugar dehydrogenase, partial [Melioribacteraceae bacterium]|nr:nucleotide sugar dehydrogenase [Melioribacteraceae bacterium]